MTSGKRFIQEEYVKNPHQDPYFGKYVKVRHLPTRTPSEKSLLSKIQKLSTKSCYVSMCICDRGYMLRETTFDLDKDKDREMFYAEAMKMSLSHTIARMKGNFILEWCLVPSRDGQTNITPDIIDTTYTKLMELKDERACTAVEWMESMGIGMSAQQKGY